MSALLSAAQQALAELQTLHHGICPLPSICPTALAIAELSKAIIEARAAPQHAPEATAPVRSNDLSVMPTPRTEAARLPAFKWTTSGSCPDGFWMEDGVQEIVPADKSRTIEREREYFAITLRAIRDMTDHDQDNEHRLRNMARVALERIDHAPVATFTPVGGPIIFMLPEESKKDRALATMHAALERINRWFGEFPPTGRFYEESGEPISYSAAFGSNGERDYMRQVALDALLATMDATDKKP